MPNVVQRRVALLGEDGKFADSMTPQLVLDIRDQVQQIEVEIDAHLAGMLAKSANLADVPSPTAARQNLGAAAAHHTPPTIRHRRPHRRARSESGSRGRVRADRADPGPSPRHSRACRESGGDARPHIRAGPARRHRDP